MPKNDGRGRLGGRKKGTPNRANKEIRIFITELLTEKREQFKADLFSLEPIDCDGAFIQPIKHVVSSLQSGDINAVMDKVSDPVEDTLKVLSEEEK